MGETGKGLRKRNRPAGETGEAGGSGALLEQTVVVDRVVTPVDDHTQTVDTQPGRLGDLGGLHVDRVAGEDRDRGAVLRTDQDGLRLAVPQVGVAPEEPVQYRHAALVAVELDRGRELVRHVDDAVLGEDEAGANVVHLGITDGDQQDRGVVLAGAVAVLGVELGVTADADGAAVDLVELLAVLVVGRDRAGLALEGELELVGRLAEQRAAGSCQQCDHGGDGGEGREPPVATGTGSGEHAGHEGLLSMLRNDGRGQTPGRKHTIEYYTK